MELINAFRKLYNLFDKREKRNTVVMIGLITIGALAETIGVGIILPFVTVILDPTIVNDYDLLNRLYHLSFVGTHKRFIILLCASLILLFSLKSLYMFFLLYIQNRYTLNRQILMSKRLFSSYMSKHYEYFFEKNSAELQRNVNIMVPSVINKFLMPSLSLLTEILIVLFILIVLLIADPVSAIVLTIVLCGIGMLFYLKVKKRLGTTSKSQNINFVHMNKSVLEGIASIKEIKVMGREDYFVDIYNKNSKEYAKTQSFFNLANQSPRLLIESLAVSGIVLIVLVNVLNGSDMNTVLPVLALFAMAAIRIMPSMNRILGYMTSLKFSIEHLNVVYEDVRYAKDLVKKTPASQFTPKETRKDSRNYFKNEIVVKNLTYRYPNTTVNILEGANMIITKGQSVGIVGPSGGGKTTLVDLLLGLLEPTEGTIFVDGTDIQKDMSAWRSNLGYVPQVISLVDDTIMKNVAFGINEKLIDTQKVWDALDAAQLKDFVENLPEKLDTIVGQNGMLLSGGQRQRIGIARALYHDPEVLILDEATSALDTEVEKAISEAITTIGASKTMIIIAHRVNTLEKCDIIFKVEKKNITDASFPVN